VTLATGVGSFPGTDPDEAVRIVVGELPDLPHLPELPERGANLQPAGWRLTGGGPGLDQRRARSQLGQDLDMLEESLQGFTGHLKVQVTGPWTLAATVERPRGDKVLADHGNRRELAQALAEGVRDHLADVRRRVPGAGPLLLQVDEPALGAVLRAEVPTASGFGRHRSVDRPELSEHLEWLFAAATESGAVPWVHSCAAGTPLDLLRGAGARGLSVDTSVLVSADHDVLGEALETGEGVALGLVPAVDPTTVPTAQQLTDQVLGWLDRLGLDPDVVGQRLLVTPACGLAGASPAWARRALALCREVATNLT
jgi:methionine synthase II (cobalamin-independent)